MIFFYSVHTNVNLHIILLIHGLLFDNTALITIGVGGIVNNLSTISDQVKADAILREANVKFLHSLVNSIFETLVNEA
jgi:hypothetical protein